MSSSDAQSGACADPACPVLHADQANPIHPPSYVPGGPFFFGPCPNCGHPDISFDAENEEFCAACGWTTAEDVPDA